MPAILMFLLLTLSSFVYSTTNILLIGDSGKRNQGQLDVSESMHTLCKKERCDMGILAGDNVYPAGVTSSWDPIMTTVFDNYYNKLKIPFVVALGNHDYGRFSLNRKRAAYQLLHAQRNPLFILPHYWYVKETPESVFAVIDTTRLMWKRDVFVQADMIKQAHQRALQQKKWFMVVGHHPYLSNGPHGNAGRYEGLRFPYFVSGKHIKIFMNNHVCGKADFYLAGHDHSLQILDGNTAGCNTQLIVSGSAATATSLKSRNYVLFESLQLGFFHLSVDRSSVIIRAFNEKTEVIHEQTYTKQNPNLADI